MTLRRWRTASDIYW